MWIGFMMNLMAVEIWIRRTRGAAIRVALTFTVRSVTD
jgi:hypothetical protein